MEADTNHSLPDAAPDPHKRSPGLRECRRRAELLLTPQSALAHTATHSAGCSGGQAELTENTPVGTGGLSTEDHSLDPAYP